MPRYSFHDELKKAKENPKGHILPKDINAPVINFLEKAGCVLAADEIKKAQEKLQYKTIEIVRNDMPNFKVVIQVDCGMADGYKECEIKESGNWKIFTSTTVKNKNLDKAKPKTTPKKVA